MKRESSGHGSYKNEISDSAVFIAAKDNVQSFVGGHADIDLSPASLEEVAFLISFSPDEGIKKAEVGEYTNSVIKEMIQLSLGENTVVKKKIADDIIDWVAFDPANRAGVIEEIIAEIFNDAAIEDPWSLSVFRILAETGQIGTNFFVKDNLVKSMELRRGFSQSAIVSELQVLNRLNNTEGNMLLHKISDFINRFGVTMQDHMEKELEETGFHQSLFMELCSFLEEEKNKSTNFLVKEHFEDVLGLVQMFDSEKKGALPGVPGGGTDEVIFAHEHIKETVANCGRLGIREGYPISNPVLSIAPGYVGYYENGLLKKIYTEAHDGDNYLVQEKQYIANNHSEDDYIYDQINEPIVLHGRFSSPSNKLRKLQVFWDFKRHLKDQNRNFYFDTSRIAMAELHPMVIAEIYTKNREYIRLAEGAQSDSVPIEKKEYYAHLFPAGEADENSVYEYQYLVRLGMRKRIEEEFGIDLSEHDFWVQRNFLFFLERASVEDAKRLQIFVHKFGSVGMKTFLSLDSDRQNGERIMLLGELLDQQTVEIIFNKFADVIKTVDVLREYIAKTFAEQKISEAEVVKITRRIVQKGRDMLATYAALAQDTSNKIELSERISRDLADYKESIILFASTFKIVAEHKPPVFAEIKTAELSAKDSAYLTEKEKNEMTKIFVANRYEYPKELLDNLVAEFSEVINSVGKKFYVLNSGDDLVSFMRFDFLPNGNLYAGSLNVRPEARGSAIGSAMLQAALDREAETHSIEAVVYEKNPMLKHYIKDFGFEITGEDGDYHGTGQKFFNLIKRQKQA